MPTYLRKFHGTPLGVPKNFLKYNFFGSGEWSPDVWRRDREKWTSFSGIADLSAFELCIDGRRALFRSQVTGWNGTKSRLPSPTPTKPEFWMFWFIKLVP